MYAYLKCQISSLHPQIGTDVFVNGPSEFIVQFPSNKRHQYGPQCQDAWYRNQIGAYDVPEVLMWISRKRQGSLLDLVHLHCSVDQKANIVHT